MAFEVDEFVERCSKALRLPDTPNRIAAIVQEAISDPEAIASTIRERGASSMADIFVNSDELTIYHVAFPPHLYGVPHDHAGWAVIGVYWGAESFNFYGEEDGALVRRGRKAMKAPAVEILGADLIHDIENPSPETSGSIHIYSNRHFDMPGRRIWRDDSASPEPFTLERSIAYGMERTNRIRRDLGMKEAVIPDLPPVGQSERA